MKLEKKYLLGIIGLIVILLTGVSYAYFKARINGDPKSIVIKSKGVYLEYKGDTTLSSGEIGPGWSVTKTFTVENQGSNTEKYDIYIKDLVNTFVTTGNLQYKITSSTGYNMTEFKDIPKSETATDTVLAYSVSIDAGVTQSYTITLKYNDTDDEQSGDMGKKFSGTLGIQLPTKKVRTEPTSILTAILDDNPTISERTDFSVTNVANTTGTLYKTNKTEDDSYVYYYSGNTTNNWVKFGTYQVDTIRYRGTYSSSNTDMYKEYDSLTECQNGNYFNKNCSTFTYSNAGDDMYWRIIRTNEDGSIRLLYAGTSPDTTEGYILRSAYNGLQVAGTGKGSEDTGYMYGGTTSLADNRTNTNNSIIKAAIDNWYKNNLLNSYDKYISKSAIYCNDRSISSGSWTNTESTTNPDNAAFYNAAHARLGVNKSPSYKCGANESNGLIESSQSIEDKFSASTTGGGNGQLKYPIALMTADEIAFAGNVYGSGMLSPYAWFYTNSKGASIVGKEEWYTMTPNEVENSLVAMIYTQFSYSTPFGVEKFSELLASSSYGQDSVVRPAISLSSCVKVTGTGTPEDPYVVDYDNSCK